MVQLTFQDFPKQIQLPLYETDGGRAVFGICSHRSLQFSQDMRYEPFGGQRMRGVSKLVANARSRLSPSRCTDEVRVQEDQSG